MSNSVWNTEAGRRIPIICEGYCQLKIESSSGMPTQTPSIAMEGNNISSVLTQGWALATGFTPDGQSILICPKCVERVKWEPS